MFSVVLIDDPNLQPERERLGGSRVVHGDLEVTRNTEPRVEVPQLLSGIITLRQIETFFCLIWLYPYANLDR